MHFKRDNHIESAGKSYKNAILIQNVSQCAHLQNIFMNLVLNQLKQTFSSGMVTQFTRRLGWSNVELLVSQFGARLQFGAQRELLDLLRLDCLTALQARALYNNGIQALSDLATASVGKVQRALARATPFLR